MLTGFITMVSFMVVGFCSGCRDPARLLFVKKVLAAPGPAVGLSGGAMILPRFTDTRHLIGVVGIGEIRISLYGDRVIWERHSCRDTTVPL